MCYCRQWLQGSRRDAGTGRQTASGSWETSAVVLPQPRLQQTFCYSPITTASSPTCIQLRCVLLDIVRACELEFWRKYALLSVILVTFSNSNWCSHATALNTYLVFEVERICKWICRVYVKETLTDLPYNWCLQLTMYQHIPVWMSCRMRYLSIT